MPKFRDIILLAHASRLINIGEFVLLYDVIKPKNPDLPYTNYDHFELAKMTDDEWSLMVSTEAAKNIKQEQNNNFPPWKTELITRMRSNPRYKLGRNFFFFFFFLRHGSRKL